MIDQYTKSKKNLIMEITAQNSQYSSFQGRHFTADVATGHLSDYAPSGKRTANEFRG